MSDERKYETARYDSYQIREAERRAHAAQSGSTARPDPEAAHRAAIRRKARRQQKMLRNVLWVVFVVVASLILSGVGWLLANDFAALNKEPLEATVTVTKDDDLGSVAKKLKQEGLIKYKWFFKLFGRVAKAESKIGIGSYTLNTEMDYSALINGMRNRNAALNAETVRVSIPEGYTVKQIIAQLELYGVNTEEELMEAAKNYDLSWKRINGEDWVRILVKYPQLVDKCDWSEVTNRDWVELLRERPEFVDICPDERWKSKMWKILTANNWTRLLEAQPQLAKYKPEQ